MAAVMGKLSIIFLLALLTLNLISNRVTVADEPPRSGIENISQLTERFAMTSVFAVPERNSERRRLSVRHSPLTSRRG
ncbi:MAG TPA: hypothetical protein VK117_07875, partial [Pyrinomonadaceae bacterium]|nr:hypothetical protein [Pyrinomonadaceae bacterium]